ncbi:MAG: TRAP transporter small permease [Clostridia bacterium]|nr:TRAP transporter small permease [Clostridia bacterium]
MKILKWLDKNGELLICSVALAGLFICMILSVFFRYVLNSSLTWVEELGCYLFVWFSLVGVAYSTKTGAHLRVDVVVNLVPKPVRNVMNFLSELVMTLFFLYMSVEGMKALISIMENGTTSPAMRMPMWILYLSFWLGCVLSLIRLVQSWYKKLTEMRKNKKEGMTDAR